MIDNLISRYESVKLYNYKQVGKKMPNSVYYDELDKCQKNLGVLKCNYHDETGRLLQIYSEKDNHALIIASTGSGKTTSGAIPIIYSNAKMATKKSMIISDPKGELYRNTSKVLENEGYRILVFNFRDYNHSEGWNPLTKIYKLYKSIHKVDEIKEIKEDAKVLYKYKNKIYNSYANVASEIEKHKNIALGETLNEIDKITEITIPIKNQKDPYWEQAARSLLKSFLLAGLEDSMPETKCPVVSKLITEETYSFSTINSLMKVFAVDSRLPDSGYFLERSNESLAKQLFIATMPIDVKTTFQCVKSCLEAALSVFRETTVKYITNCNTFDFSVLTEDKPVALYIIYRDEITLHYQIISLLIQEIYIYLINHANKQPNGKRKIPIYFLLEEFGNFPSFPSFENSISISAGRNIFFILILQSYAQLNAIYGAQIAEIIKDNLNIHIFLGSNNPNTISEFSKECGSYTRISPFSVLKGFGDNTNSFEMETIPVITKSSLVTLKPGECIVTEANCGYVLFSMLERYYQCKEFSNLPLADINNYKSAIDILDRRYIYEGNIKKSKYNDYF